MIESPKSSVLGGRIRGILNALVSAEIGAVAPMSDRLTQVRSSGMAPSSRDRITVDLHGLKAALFERARAMGLSPSGLVRSLLAEALGMEAAPVLEPSDRALAAADAQRVRLCLRMDRERARATLEASRRAGLSLGEFVGGLLANIPVLSAGGGHTEHIAGLVASCAELSTLSRNIHRLTALLRQANVEPARPYREMLDTLAGDVRRHLELAARVLADLQPQSRNGRPAVRSSH
jgi:hypothetical protein